MTNISHLLKLKNDSVFLQTVSDDGLLMEKLEAYDLMEHDVFTMSMTSSSSSVCKTQSSNEPLSVTHESVVIIKNTILNDKLSCCNQNIQMQESSKTLVQVSTGNARDLQPFWKPCTKELSTQLWSPTKTDRFGNELVEWIFKKADVKLVVLSKGDDQEDPSRELSEDLLAITTVFVARNNGLRAGRYRRQRNEKDGAQNEEHETNAGET